MSVSDLWLITPNAAPSEARREAPYDVLARWLLQTEPRRQDAWALVDELSCALTLVIPEDNDRLTRLDPPDRDETQHLLTRLIERFMGHKVAREPGLLRRPALQLVLCPRNGALTELALEQAVSKVELLHRRIEARVGLDLPDFKLTLEDTPRAAPGVAEEALRDPETPEGAMALSTMAQAFHLRFLPSTSQAPRLMASLKAVSDKVNEAKEGVRRSAELLSVSLGADPVGRAQTLLAQVRDLRELPDTIAPRLGSRERADALPDTTTTPSPFRLSVAARHWVRPDEPRPEHAASLPLGALSLIVAENAAGKTSAAETFSILTADLPRARPLPPPGSEALDGAVTLDMLGPASALIWDNTSMLPIFSDDSGLTEGTPGALSVATMWPSVASNETLAALGALARAARAFARWTEGEQLDEFNPTVAWHASMTADRGASELVAARVDELFEGKKADEPPYELSVDHFDALNEWAGSVRRATQTQTTETDEGGGADAPQTSADAPPIEALRALWPTLAPRVLDELLRAIPDEARLRAVLEFEALVQPKDEDPRLSTLLLRARREAFTEAVVALGAWEDWADRQFEWVLGVDETQRKKLDEMTDRLDQLLSHDVWHNPTRRRNTAALVRLSVAARLARAVLLSPHSLPMLTLDEPTLGQHRVASARAIARITRLARVVEGTRWQRALQESRVLERAPTPQRSPAAPTPLAAGRLTLSRPKGAADTARVELDPIAINASARLDLRPPMLLIFSYQEDALTRLAQLEGEQLTHSLGESLQRLVAPWWRAALVQAIRARDEAWRSATSRELPRAPKPALLLQQIEDELPDEPSSAPSPEERSAWLKGARDALGKLGLGPLLGPLKMDGPVEQVNTLRASRELIRWLALVELLPAVMDDAPFDLHTSGVELRRLSPEGGEARRVGALRLRRVSPVMLSRVWAHDEDRPAQDAQGVSVDTPDETTTANPASTEALAPTGTAPRATTTDTVADTTAVEDPETRETAEDGATTTVEPTTTETEAPPTKGADAADGSTDDVGAEVTTSAAPTTTPSADAGRARRPTLGALARLGVALAAFELLADEGPKAPPTAQPASPPPAVPPQKLKEPPPSPRAQLLSALLAAASSSHPEELWLRLDDLRHSKGRPPTLTLQGWPERRADRWRVSVDCAPQDCTVMGDGRTISSVHVEELLPLITRAASLREVRPRLTLLTLDCTPPVAVAAGFHHNLLSGRAVDVIAGLPGQTQTRFELRERADLANRAIAPKEEPATVLPRGVELHVLVTLTPRANRDPYDRWRGEQPTPKGPPTGLLWFDGFEAVNDGAQAVSLASALHRAIVRHRPEGAPLRLFLALPNVVSFALGQRLLNLGEVKLMELRDQGTPTAPELSYVEWGPLKT